MCLAIVAALVLRRPISRREKRAGSQGGGQKETSTRVWRVQVGGLIKKAQCLLDYCAAAYCCTRGTALLMLSPGLPRRVVRRNVHGVRGK